jgi:hypothetical protein
MTRLVWPGLTASLAALLAAAPSARAEDCVEVDCHEEERNCRIEIYPCGENTDGTVIFCSERVCDRVTVCRRLCLTMPDRDALLGGLDLPGRPGSGWIDPVPFQR